jgi:hypothetical protein
MTGCADSDSSGMGWWGISVCPTNPYHSYTKLYKKTQGNFLYKII